MNFFSSVVAAFCAASIFIGALYLICPEGVMSKPVKYALEVVFLISVITVAGIISKNHDFSAFSKPYTKTDSSPLETYAFEYAVKSALNDADIDFKKIAVVTDKTEDGSIVIIKVIVVSDCEKDKIAKLLGEIEVEVINE